MNGSASQFGLCAFASFLYVQGFCEPNVCLVTILEGTVFFFSFYSHAYVRIIYERIKG